MTPRETLIHLLNRLLREMDVVQSQGAGYYTCVPFARRFNKLLEEARNVMAGQSAFLGTFDHMEETDPKDPGEKSKRLLGIRIEITQLIGLLEAFAEDVPPQRDHAGQPVVAPTGGQVPPHEDSRHLVAEEGVRP